MMETIEEQIAFFAGKGKEKAAIEEVKRALINQILQHTKAEIHDQLPWVYQGMPDSVITKSLTQPDIPILNLIATLAKLAFTGFGFEDE